MLKFYYITSLVQRLGVRGCSDIETLTILESALMRFVAVIITCLILNYYRSIHQQNTSNQPVKALFV